MKKIYVILAVVFAFVAGADTKTFAVNFTGHSEYDTCGGTVSYSYSINASTAGLTVNTYFGDGTSASGSLFGTYGYNYHNYGLPGIYTVKHVLSLSGVPVDSLIFTDTIMCESAYIAAYLDV